MTYCNTVKCRILGIASYSNITSFALFTVLTTFFQVYSTSTTPASAAKLPNLFGAAGTSSSAVGNLPASLAAVLPALAGRSNALAQSATPAASAFTVPAAQTPLTALAAASSALSGNAAQVAQVCAMRTFRTLHQNLLHEASEMCHLCQCGCHFSVYARF